MFLFQSFLNFYNNYYINQEYISLKNENKKLIKENNNLKYKLDGVKLAKDEIYTKYQLLIIKN